LCGRLRSEMTVSRRSRSARLRRMQTVCAMTTDSHGGSPM
jgi:hypothetical protein